jgi:hypothetical protein
MNREERIKRIEELMKPIDQQIMMCDDDKDLLMMASAMIATAKQILITNIGRDGAREIFNGVMLDD